MRIMKNILFILLSLCIVFCAASCERDVEEERSGIITYVFKNGEEAADPHTETLKEGDIIIEADMKGMETVTGKCTVNAMISIRNHSNCWAIGSYQVDVNIG